jgi:hypothetical protein
MAETRNRPLGEAAKETNAIVWYNEHVSMFVFEATLIDWDVIGRFPLKRFDTNAKSTD